MSQTKATVPRIIVHIGAPKTGTNAVQRSLYASSSRLLERGTYYPTINYNHYFLRLSTFDKESDAKKPFATRRGFTRLDEVHAYVEKAWRQIHQVLATHPVDTLVLSSEWLINAPIRDLKHLRDDLATISSNVHVVCYVRHPLPLAVSASQQSIKVGHRSLADVDEAPPIFAYKRRLQAFLSVFPHEAVHVREFRRDKLHGGDIVSDFLTRFEIGEPAALIRPAENNKSLSMPAVMIASEITRFERRAGRRLVQRALLRRIGGAPFRLPSKALDQVRLKANDEVNWLRERFSLELEEPPVAPRTTTKMPLIEPAATLSAIVLCGLARLRELANVSRHPRLRMLLNPRRLHAIVISRLRTGQPKS